MANVNIKKILENQYCVGCGVCTVNSECIMHWNRYGFLEPQNIKDLNEDVHKVCPFNLEPEFEVKTEDEIAAVFLPKTPSHNKILGKYYDTYVGSAEEFRGTSSSGGLATYILCELLDKQIVDYVVSVGEATENHYTYKICRNKSEVLETSKTKYYPVSMSSALKEMKKLDGSFAIVGTACFVKSIRLLQYYDKSFRDKIKFTVGIICGGQKSRFYTDFLVSHLSLSSEKYSHPQFRIKNIASYALDYSFGCNDEKGGFRELRMAGLGDMCGTGTLSLFSNPILYPKALHL